MANKEKSKPGKRLLVGIMFLASLLGSQAFAISLGQGFPQAIRQSVIVNEKLQTTEQDVLLLAGAQPPHQGTKLETASGGFFQKPLKSIGGLTFETRYSTGFTLTLSAGLHQAEYYDPIMGRFLSVDPLGFVDSLNLYQAFGNNPINFTDCPSPN